MTEKNKRLADLKARRKPAMPSNHFSDNIHQRREKADRRAKARGWQNY